MKAHQLEPLLGQHFWLVRRAPDEVVADRGYSINAVYQLLRRDSILPSIPRRIPWRTTASGRKFESGFTYVPSVDRYRCPKSKWRTEAPLHPGGAVHDQPTCGWRYKPMGRRPSQNLEGQA